MNFESRKLVNVPILSDEESNNLEGLITNQEVLSPPKCMKHDKSPGSDGYTTEFFEFFFVGLVGLMVRSISNGFRKWEMSITQRQGMISCIPKEGKDKTFWRPSTLRNTVYGISSSCIPRRLKTVLPKLIHEDQKVFLIGRCMAENIRLLYDTLLYASKHYIPSLLLMLNFEKAFDSDAWSVVEKSLNVFNFGQDIKR